MWINNSYLNYEIWERYLKETLKFERTDRTDHEWINLNTGARIALVANGGWRQAQYNEDGPSEYRLMYRSPAGEIQEITTHVFGTSAVQFLRGEGIHGGATYASVQEECIAHIDELLELPKSNN